MAEGLPDLQAVIDLLYEASERKGPWEPVMARMAELLDAEIGHFFRIDSQGGLLEAPQFHGIDGETIDRYHRDYQGEDPRLLLAQANRGQAMSDVEVIDPALFEQSALYNDHLKPAGVRYTLFVDLPVDGQSSAAQAFFRGKGRAPFGRQEVEIFQRLLPHMRRALRLRGLLESAQNTVQDLRSALDALAPPTVVLDAEGRVLCASERAEALLRREDGLKLTQGRLVADLPATAAALAQGIARAARLADPVVRSLARPLPEMVEVLRAEGPPLRLVLAPLRDTNTFRAQGHHQARVLLVLHEEGASRRLEPGLVALLHRLTPTEALLATALAEGKTVTQFARERGTSEHTVRTQLKRVLEKTGTQRQVDLVGLILRTTGGYPGP